MTSSSPADAIDPSGALALVGKVVAERYRVEKLIGKGGMGAVYLAEHTHMRKRVALKVLLAEVRGNEEVLARFEREARAASAIDHPNVVAATDFGRIEGGGFFLVLEYVEGTSLREALKGPFTATRALHIARQIALGLERAHEAGIVHRDLKPENVMLVSREDDPDFVKVLDFGIAKMTETVPAGVDPSQPLTMLGAVLGTPEYMAPEQALGEAITPAADLYALGVILYEMLAGVHMFDPPDRMAMLSFHMVAPVPKIGDRAPGVEVAPEIETIVKKLVEKAPKARYASARELVHAIDEVTGGRPASSAHLLAAAPSSAQIIAAPPSSTRGLDPEPAWKDTDSFAKTNIGLPAQPPAPGFASMRTVIGMVAALPRAAQVALAAALPLGLVLVVSVIVVAARGPGSDARGGLSRTSGTAAGKTEPARPPKLAPAERARAAQDKGPEALEALAKDFPEDRALKKQAAIAYIAEGRATEAMRVVREALEADPQAGNDPELVQVVVATAEKRSETTADEEAFSLLEGPLGERGVDALIELSGRNHRALKGRATRSLAKPEVRAHASPSAEVLLDFREAKSCGAKRDLFGRAREAGDARLLAILKPMKQTRGCGFLGVRDCWPCLRSDDALDETVAALEARTDAGAGAGAGAK